MASDTACLRVPIPVFHRDSSAPSRRMRHTLRTCRMMTSSPTNATHSIPMRAAAVAVTPVLARPRLRDQAGLAHASGQKDLAQHIVDLMRTGVVEILPLEINPVSAQIVRHSLRKVQPERPARVSVQKFDELPVEPLVVFTMVIRFFQFDGSSIHQCLGDVLSAMRAEVSVKFCLFFCLRRQTPPFWPGPLSRPSLRPG